MVNGIELNLKTSNLPTLLGGRMFILIFLNYSNENIFASDKLWIFNRHQDRLIGCSMMYLLGPAHRPTQLLKS